MRILLNAPSDRKILPGADDRGNFEKLRELGLARKLDLARFLLLMLAWGIGTGVGLYILTRIVPSFLPTTVSIGFILEGSVISGLVFAAAMALLYTNYSLTEFGKKLQRSALRFYPTRAKIREFRLASLVPSGFLSWAAVALVIACGAPLLLSRLLSGSESRATAELAPNARITEGSIAAFTEVMRAKVLEGETPFRRAYLRSVIDKVEVDDAEIRIKGRKSVLERLVTAGGKDMPAVPSFVREWRAIQNIDPNKSRFLASGASLGPIDLFNWNVVGPRRPHASCF
ncbi:hypothetical protein [Bradyrhizobium liaoningense]|uniref:hypothetical protein n=1 Tax=Bradyrhizobium liaoningense TaxID=43992 RepID=UPI001BAA5D6C|nr:hypothetical protein [Bradyrhizobium liaoningense]MBR1030336.1 hypothetical protein [Bradyrhizobium liaoningense]